MGVKTVRAVTVPRIVSVPVIVAIVARRVFVTCGVGVLVAALTTLGLGVSHACLLSRRCVVWW